MFSDILFYIILIKRIKIVNGQVLLKELIVKGTVKAGSKMKIKCLRVETQY